MIMHLMIFSSITRDYIKFCEVNFYGINQEFYLYKGSNEHNVKIEEKKNVIVIKNKLELIKFYLKLLVRKKTIKIYIHGLYFPYLIFILYIKKSLLRSSYWLIWGADLYSYKNNKKGILKEIIYRIEKFVKGNFYGYITHLEGDYELAKKWYGAKGKYFNCFMYPSNLYKKIKIENKATENKTLFIQIGNSANPSNNHFEILEKLQRYKGKNIKIYCPLSYAGEIRYIESVIKEGKKIFNNNFIPITEFMCIEEYIKLLSNIDIAIFAHDRQQAVGNITSLLGMKKTVYLKENVTTWEMLNKLGVMVKSFERLEELENFDNDILEKNKEIIKKRFSKNNLVKEWKKIFKDDLE